MSVPLIGKELSFPNPTDTNEEGILAIGGDLTKDRLLLAYTIGVFPWFSLNRVPFWFCPDPRFVLFPDDLKVSKSMHQLFKRKAFEVKFDTQFEKVISNCAIIKRNYICETWITEDFIEAYYNLHKAGYAHSIEVYQNDNLVGGLYGVSLGKCFFGESMFSQVSNASKYGFITLVNTLKKNNFTLIDCQANTEHLASLGAKDIDRIAFLELLKSGLASETYIGSWENKF